MVPISLPFQYFLYGQPFGSLNANSNGNLQFSGANADPNNLCLPAHTLQDAILAYWDDLRTDCGGCGIFTSEHGAQGSRIFNIEWRATDNATLSPVNFEARLYEGQNRFDIVYGQVAQNGNGATVGVQMGA